MNQQAAPARPLSALQHPAMSQPGIAHAFFTRNGGVSHGLYASLNAGRGSNDDPSAVAENRRRMAAHFAIAPDALVSMHQTHSANVALIDAPTSERPRVDALVTRTDGIAVGVLAADCGPVLFADPHARVVAGAHAGWRGATGGILEATLDTMESAGARRQSITAVLGPTIAQASYEVGPEFAERLIALAPDNAAFLVPSDRPGHHRFDLPAYIVGRLKEAGVGHVHDLALDTYADEARFFSYRRTTHRGEPDYGRLLSAIMLER